MKQIMNKNKQTQATSEPKGEESIPTSINENNESSPKQENVGESNGTTKKIEEEDIPISPRKPDPMDDAPLPTSKPGGTGGTGAPSWADFMKQMEQEEATKPPEEKTKTTPKKPVTKKQHQLLILKSKKKLDFEKNKKKNEEKK